MVSLEHKEDINNRNIELQIRDMLSTENHELKMEISELKRELDELHDSFRTKDAEEFKRVQMELEFVNKKCRVMQYKLSRLEKKNEELSEEKFNLEDYLVIARTNSMKVEELEEELSIAKEVSVRLHKELEDSEETRIKCENLNLQLKDQFNELQKAHSPSDDQLSKVSEQLYNSLQRQYMQAEKISELDLEIKTIQSNFDTENESRQTIIDVDQKLIMLHNYVCRLRNLIDQKDQIIEKLKHCTNMPIDLNDDLDNAFIDQCNAEDFPIFDKAFLSLQNTNDKEMTAYSQNSVDASIQCRTTECDKEIMCQIMEPLETSRSDDLEEKEIGQLRSLLKEYMTIKDELEGSLRDAGEILLSKDQELDELRTERKNLGVELEQFQSSIEARIKVACQKHTDLIEGLRRENDHLRQGFDSLRDELRTSRQEQNKTEQERLHQLQELRSLEQNYRDLGERLNTEVCQLTKQITQLNEDKERLESDLSKIKSTKVRQPISRLIVNQTPTTVGSAKPPLSNKIATSTDRTRRNINGLGTTEPKIDDNQTVRVKLQQHSFNQKSNTEIKTEPTRIARNRIPNGNRVHANGADAKSITRGNVTRPNQTRETNSQLRKIPVIKSSKPSDHIADRKELEANNQRAGTGKSISNKAQSIISRIRYRSSSRASARLQGDKIKKESKLPKPVQSNLIEIDHISQISDADVVLNKSLQQNIENIEYTGSASTRSLKFSDAQMETLMNKITSTTRPLMMNSNEEGEINQV